MIQSLPAEEMGPVVRIRNDVESALKRTNAANLFIYNPQTLDELLLALEMIASDTSSNTNPLLQLDMHGNSTEGCKLASGEFISWPALLRKLGEINRQSVNRLAVISCVCFSFKLIRLAGYDQPAPFNFLAAPGEKISINFLQQSMDVFYQKLIDGRDIASAINVLQPQFSFHWPEYHLFFAIRDEFTKFKGRKGRAEVELAVTAAMNSGNIDKNTIATFRRKLRRFAQELTDDDLIKMFGTYLCGRIPFFTAQDVLTHKGKPYWMNQNADVSLRVK